MKIILQADVQGLGAAGDVKKVADGYARNHLIPRGLALEANQQRLKDWEKNQQKLQQEKAAGEKQARTVAEKLEATTIKLNRPAGEGGRLFGSVTAADAAQELEQLGFKVDKKKIDLAEPIKSLGSFTATVKLFPGVKARLRIEVEQEKQ